MIEILITQYLFDAMISYFISVNTIRERRAAIICQCAYRSYIARSKLFDLICVSELSVLRCSSSAPFHGPEKALEHRKDTFWIAESKVHGLLILKYENKFCVKESFFLLNQVFILIEFIVYLILCFERMASVPN